MGLGGSVIVNSENNQLSDPETKVDSAATMTNGLLFEPHPCSEVVASVAAVCDGSAECCTGSNVNWHSVQSSPSVVRQSRLKHRQSLGGSRLNTTFVDGTFPNATTGICDIRRVEENLRMESIILSQNKNIPMARASTPSQAYCFHCDHDHRERCCLYVGDKPEDGPNYSRWKRDLENPTVRPQYVPKIPEALSGNSTPDWFPAYTFSKPADIRKKMAERHPPPPPVYMRQYYYPIVGYGHEYRLMNQPSVEPPTPYQLYLQQHQQEQPQPYSVYQAQAHHVYTGNPAMRNMARHQCDSRGTMQGTTSSAAYQPQYHHSPMSERDYNTQPAAQYTYYHPAGYYPPAQQHYLPPAPPTYLPHQQQYVPVGYSVTTVPHREPPPPTSATTPLWLLFCQKLTRKFPDRSKKNSPTKAPRPSGKNFNPAGRTGAYSGAPEYLHPPKYSNIDHPHLQYPGAVSMMHPQPYCPSPVAVAAGQQAFFYDYVPVHQPVTDIGMCYVPPPVVNM
ncbi:uncharacterized protein LOC131208054 [Anopheles bellator]|uniref:uncharacterized protein LOC131208054 n=1 Tax=Anopheles bellator TaxID=139047 RepID=UPI002648059C|nr:uncharacterized protein LOC131208054 [Anopheles bellator]